jgi:probable phosphoglycerate mutase
MNNSNNNHLLKKPFYFIRHGQTDWNAQEIIMGQQDIPLNATGAQQAAQIQHLVKSLPITHVYHSPLQRAEQTMKIVTQELSCSIHPLDLLTEWHLGDLQGTMRSNAAREKFIEFTPPGGESAQDFVKRVHNGLHHILSSSETPLLVAHSGVYSALCHILNIEDEPIDHCELACFYPDEKGGSWRTKRINS